MEVAKVFIYAYLRQNEALLLDKNHAHGYKFIPSSIKNICMRYYYIYEQWNMKEIVEKMINGLTQTYLSLYIPPDDNYPIDRIQTILMQEQGTCSSIKSRRRRLSVINIIMKTRELLKGYKQIPRNGLVIYSAFGYQQDLKQNYQYYIHFEPFLSIMKRLYTVEYSVGFKSDPILPMIQQQNMMRVKLLQ